MPRGRFLPPLEMTEQTRQQLESMAKSRSLPHGLVRRAEIVLLAAEGWPNKAIGEAVGLSQGAGGKSLRSYATLLAAEARSRHIDVSYVRIPIPDVSVPSVSTMRLILGAIDSALDEGRPTYVHCWGGRGRTGTVVGCYLARHRTETDEDALTTIERLRRGEETGSKASPETVEQCDMVRAWAG